LADSGGARARDALLAKMNTSDEVDRGSLLVALRGIVARAPSDAAVARLAATLELSVGAERDAILTVVSRATSASALAVLQNTTRSQDADDRKAAASGLSNFASAGASLLPLLSDREPAVRAQAAWSCGFVCGADALPKLASLVAEHDTDSSANAAAAIGKIAARAKNTAFATTTLCPRTEDARPLVRMNAIIGAMTAGARCDGTLRKLLEEDASESVRVAAARAVARSGAKEDVTALEHCARADRSGPVASRCRDELRGETASALASHAVEVYVVPGGAQNPEPHAHYALLLADGFTHAGNADRRGAVFESFAPAGTIELLRVE
ncbi:MAG: HEAT repeat domain-containing protein, partial [Polyangiaceae bacterium]